MKDEKVASEGLRVESPDQDPSPKTEDGAADPRLPPCDLRTFQLQLAGAMQSLPADRRGAEAASSILLELAVGVLVQARGLSWTAGINRAVMAAAAASEVIERILDGKEAESREWRVESPAKQQAQCARQEETAAEVRRRKAFEKLWEPEPPDRRVCGFSGCRRSNVHHRDREVHLANRSHPARWPHRILAPHRRPRANLFGFGRSRLDQAAEKGGRERGGGWRVES